MKKTMTLGLSDAEMKALECPCGNCAQLATQNAEMKRLLRLAEKKLRQAAFKESMLRRLHEHNKRIEDWERGRPLRAYFSNTAQEHLQ